MTGQPAWRRATSVESRWAVSGLMAVMIVLQLMLPPDFSPVGHWTLPVIEAVLLVVLLIASVTTGGEGRVLRILSLVLIIVASIANGLAVVLLVDDLVREHLHFPAGTLLGAGANIWLTNVIVFAVWFWELDRGGPQARARGLDPHPDFLFPQMVTSDVAPAHWEPRILDYLYVSFTNATAFSPTDTMPLTRGAKLGMMLEEAISLATAILVIARAVNILN